MDTTETIKAGELTPNPEPAPAPIVPQITSRNKEDIFYVFLLLLNLTTTTHAFQTIVKPQFGKSFGSLAFDAGTLLSFILFSFTLQDNAKKHRRALEIMSLLQVATGVAARSLGAVAAPVVEDPTIAAFVVHSLLSFPTIGLGGAVWLQWMRKFTEPEPTRMGRLSIGVFTCVALVTILRYTEPLVEQTIIQYANFSPKATLICLGMTTYTLSALFKPDRSVSEVQRLSRFITVLSVFMLMLVVSIPPRTPSVLSIQLQRHTPAGLIQVIDSRATIPMTRYLRVDASIVGSMELDADRNVAASKDASASLLEAVTLTENGGKRALVLGVHAGVSAKSLISSSYATTIVDDKEGVVSAAREYFGLPEPARVVIEDPSMWVRHSAAQLDEPKFDIVVHDTLEGGEMPAKLFTMEFWTALRSIMDAQGVIAVRYVGKPSAVAFRSILNMLRKNFNTCRAFHSNVVGQSPLSTPNEVAEIVIFCTPVSSLGFNKPSSTLSHSTSALLSTLETRELNIATILDQVSPERYLLKEADPVMARWGKESITDYWHHMRQRFPAPIWYSY